MSIKYCSCSIMEADFNVHNFIIHTSESVSYSISIPYTRYDFLGFSPKIREILIAFDSDISFSSIEYLCSILKCSHPMIVFDPQLYFHNHSNLKYDIIGISEKLGRKLYYLGGKL